MPSRRKLEEAVQILQGWLSKTKTYVVAKYPKTEQFPKIEQKLQEINDWLPKLKQWEDHLMTELSTLEEDINDDIFYDNDQSNIEKINEKLKLIYEKVEGFNNAIKKMILPPINEKAATLQKQEPLEGQARVLSEDWIRLNVEEKVLGSTAMANFQASFDSLDRSSKLCLLCFSIFPDNSVIKKRPLINWWIAEGFITDNDKERSSPITADEVGDNIFQKLITVGLIQKVYKNSCKMHPWIRRMLISIAKEAEFFNFDSTGVLANDSSKSRRACLVSGGIGPKEKNLITLFNVNEQYLNLKADWFSKLEKLVVLQLGRWQTSAAAHLEVENDEFLNHLGAQKQLKYLSLHGVSRITNLPSTLVDLTNLEILELRACHNLEKLPSDIGLLRKLTHLDLSECYLLECMPKGLEKLHSLRVLKGFLIGSPWNPACKFADLAQLKKLRKLSICIGKDANAGDLDLDKLQAIASLRILAITWERVNWQSNKNDEQSSITTSASENKGDQHSSPTANSKIEKARSASDDKGDQQSSPAANSKIEKAPSASENKGDQQSSPTANSKIEKAPSAFENEGEHSIKPANSTTEELPSALENKGKQSSQTANSTIEKVPSVSENKGEHSSITANSSTEEAPSALQNKGEQSSKTANSTVEKASEENAPKSKMKFPFCSELQKPDHWHVPCWPAKGKVISAAENKGEQSSKGTKDGESSKWNISFPSFLEKLDLWCLPYWLHSLNPIELKNLKRLYIRGGKLDSIPEWKDPWKLEILRLKYLENLKVKKETLEKKFPELKQLEID